MVDILFQNVYFLKPSSNGFISDDTSSVFSRLCLSNLKKDKLESRVRALIFLIELHPLIVIVSNELTLPKESIFSKDVLSFKLIFLSLGTLERPLVVTNAQLLICKPDNLLKPEIKLRSFIFLQFLNPISGH